MTKRLLILVTVGLLGASAVRADTPQLGNLQASPRDAKTAQVSFDLTWPNAAQPGTHHVALWVFFKARAPGSAEWRHVRLATDPPSSGGSGAASPGGVVVNPKGFGQEGGAPLEFVVPTGKDGFTGMFLRRTQDGKGTLTASNVTALVEWETNIQPPTPNTQHPTPDALKPETRNLTPEVRIFAIEMSYVPEGAFDVGSSTRNSQNRLFAYTGQDVTRTERHFQTDFSDFPDNTPTYRIKGPGAIPTGRQPGKLWAQGLTPEDGGEIPASFPNGFAAFYCMRDVLSQGQYTAFLNTLTDAQARMRYYPDGHGPEIKRTGDPSRYTYTASSPGEPCPFISWADGAAFAAWAGLRPMTELEYEKSGGSGGDFRNMNVGGLNERMVSIASASGRNFAGTHGRGTPDLPADWPKDLGGVVFRGDMMGNHGGSAGARHAAINAFSDRATDVLSGWRAARSAPAGDAGQRPAPAHREVARLAVLDDGVLDEWGKPLAVLSGPDDLFPERFRLPPPADAGPDAASWQGAKDLGAKLYLGWNGDALCVAAEVTDDKHCNAYATQNITSGDALQIGLLIGKDVRWNIGLALTQTGVAFHQWEGMGDALAKTAGLAVVRDDARGVTRYELRLPLAALGLKPGKEFGLNAVVFDDDDGFGQCYRLQLAPGLAAFDHRGTGWYPRFVLAE
jgi:hypothetical protein